MKYNFLLLLAICIMAASPLFGQRLKDKRAQINYVALPAKTLPADYTTYSVRVHGGNIAESGYNSQGLANQIVMDGFKKVNHEDGGGHLRIVVNTGYVTMGRAEYKSKKNVKKDSKTGVETVTYDHWYEVPFSADAGFQIFGPDGNILATGGKNASEVRSTTSYATANELSKNYTAQLNKLRKDFAQKVVNEIVGDAASRASYDYDFNKTHDNPNFFIVEKYATEADYQKYFDFIDTEWKKIDAAAPVSELKAKFGEALAFYEKEAEIETSGDKKLLKVFEAANYNAALMHFYLDDFEKAVFYANRVIASEGGKHRLSSDLIERVQSSKKSMDLHGVNTLHYARDLSTAMAPAAVKALEKEQEAFESENNLLRGTVMINGQAIEGTVVNKKEAEELDFTDADNIKFMTGEGAAQKSYNFSAAEIESFSIGTRNFVKKNFAPCAKGKSEPAKHILEEIYTSDKISLYKYYPPAGALTEAKTEFAFKKASDTDPISLNDTRFLIFKKGLATYFADCPDLKTMCEQGEITNDSDGLLQAARIYAELCE